MVICPCRSSRKITHFLTYGFTKALWARMTKNPDVSTGPLTRLFARSLAPLACLLALDYLLRLQAPLCSLARLLAYFAHSLARGAVNDFSSCFFRCVLASL